MAVVAWWGELCLWASGLTLGVQGRLCDATRVRMEGPCIASSSCSFRQCPEWNGCEDTICVSHEGVNVPLDHRRGIFLRITVCIEKEMCPASLSPLSPPPFFLQIFTNFESKNARVRLFVL
jgi:hypothetical protein